MYAAHGVRLVERGWPAPIPLWPGEKRPSINAWERFNEEVVSVTQARSWGDRFPAHGVGHAAGHGLVGIDLDTDLEDQATLAREIADEHLRTTPMIRAGRANRVMRYYRLLGGGHRKGISTRSFHLFALYITTGQTVWYGIHPDTGAPYEWLDASPLDIGPSDLPTVTAGALMSFVEEMTSVFPEPTTDGTTASSMPGTTSLVGGGPTTQILREIALSPRTPPIEIALRWIAAAPVGTRHHTMVGAVTALVHAGLSDQEILDPVAEVHLKSVAGDRPPARTTRVVRNAVVWARGRIGACLQDLDVELRVDDWSIWT
jgi:hypothetical protein